MIQFDYMSKEVRRLYAQFQPENYKLWLDPNRKTRKITGHVTITGRKVGRPSQRLTFHQHGLTVTKATITFHDKKGDRTLEVERLNNQNSLDEVRLHTDAMVYPGAYTVYMEFTGNIDDNMHGVYPCNFELDGKPLQLIATQFESHHAREAFPCIDEPEAKATFDLVLLTPEGDAVIANTPEKSRKIVGGMRETVFETTPAMSSYLLAFVYGKMRHKDTTTASGTLVRIWATSAQPADSLDYALDRAKAGIEFFEQYYGVAYPLAKADHVALPDFSSAAMENWGLITYREPFLLAEPESVSLGTKEFITLVTAHELSHQWFGNLVTMRWWDDLWLNESFANVMEYVATDKLEPDWHIWYTAVASDGLAALRRDAIDGVQAVKVAVHHPDEISTLFDPSIVYAKGGRLIRMLMQYVGEEDFRKGLKLYFTKHAYGNTAGRDLWEALGAASGKDIPSFMEPWLTRPGYPVLSVTQKGKQLHIEQKHFLLDPKKADAQRVWPVPLLSETPQIPQLLSEKSVDVDLSSDDFVRINQGAVGHYIVHYAEPAHRAALAEQAEKQTLDVPERLMLLNDSSLLTRTGIGSFADTLALLQYYAGETNDAVWDIMALVLADARRFIDLDETLELKMKALAKRLTGKLYDKLGWTEGEKDSAETIKLRATIVGLSVYGENKQAIDTALKLFEAYKKDYSAVAAELRSICFGAAVRHNAPGAVVYLLDLNEKTSNADLQQEILAALTLTTDQDVAKILLGRLTDSTKVRQHDVDHWLAYLLRNHHVRDLAWEWLQSHWVWIEETFGGDKTYDNFPRYAASAFNTQKYLDEYRVFFKPMQHIPGLARNIALGKEELVTRVAWLERDLASVEKFFNDIPA